MTTNIDCDATGTIADLIAQVQCEHAWLDRADRYLTAHPDLPDFAKHEARYLERLQAYGVLYQELIAAIRATDHRKNEAPETLPVTQQAMEFR